MAIATSPTMLHYYSRQIAQSFTSSNGFLVLPETDLVYHHYCADGGVCDAWLLSNVILQCFVNPLLLCLMAYVLCRWKGWTCHHSCCMQAVSCPHIWLLGVISTEGTGAGDQSRNSLPRASQGK